MLIYLQERIAYNRRDVVSDTYGRKWTVGHNSHYSQGLLFAGDRTMR